MILIRGNKNERVINKAGQIENGGLILAKKAVGTFFDYSHSDIEKSYSCEYNRIKTSPDAIREVFRHSFCLALDLPSVSAYKEYSSICERYAKAMRKDLNGYRGWSREYRQGVLQAGVHMIVYATKSSKKEENYG